MPPASCMRGWTREFVSLGKRGCRCVERHMKQKEVDCGHLGKSAELSASHHHLPPAAHITSPHEYEREHHHAAMDTGDSSLYLFLFSVPRYRLGYLL